MGPHKGGHRFRPFHDKIVHIILDDIESAPSRNDASAENMWFIEDTQERMRFSKFLEWNEKQADPFSDDDMIGFGDTDEVAWRDNVWLLKHCIPSNSAIDIGIWFPMGRIDHAFRTDFPVPGHPYTLGDPTYFTIKGAKEQMAGGKPPSRNRGTSGSFLLGGMYMTRHRFLPFMILETITCTECTLMDSRVHQDPKRYV